MSKTMKLFWCLVGATLPCLPPSHAQQTEPFELPPINYSATQPQDVFAKLQLRLARDGLKTPEQDRELVQWLLRELRVPVESQVVVFSKTSFQRQRITPEHPRAIYFSDDCYVGWVPGGLMEVAAIDPQLGPVFYTVDPVALRTNQAAGVQRDSQCLSCHGGTFVRGIPAVLVRSVFADGDGEPLLRHGTKLVDFRTPFTNRWGGWYVTGEHGSALHQGNVCAREVGDKLVVDFKRGANVPKLSDLFDTRRYLANTSDIVALLVLEHQTAMQNTLTRASVNCRRMLEYQKNLQRDLKETVTDELVYESVKSVFESTAEEITKDLLFAGEAELPTGLSGSPGFQNVFLASARRTPEGDSLKDFSLKGHIFRNRCSYLIYSTTFLQLPRQLKQRVYTRLARILADGDVKDYAHLSLPERQRIAHILRATHPEMAATLGAAVEKRTAPVFDRGSSKN